MTHVQGLPGGSSWGQKGRIPKSPKYVSRPDCPFVMSLAVLLLLFTSAPAIAWQMNNDFTFATANQGMWGTGSNFDRYIDVFELPFNASGNRRDSWDISGYGFGYHLLGSANGKIGMSVNVQGSGGGIDVSYGGSIRIGYPDTWKFEKGSAVTFTTSMTEGPSHIKTSPPAIVSDLQITADMAINTSLGMTILGQGVNALDVNFDTKMLPIPNSFSLLKLHTVDGTVELLDAPELSGTLPYNNINISNGSVSICSQPMISGDIKAPLIAFDHDFTADSAGLKASSADSFINLNLDLDAIVAKVVDKKLPVGSPHKGWVPCYVHGRTSISAAGYDFKPSYDTLDLKLNLGVSKKQEFTFKPNVQVTMNFSSPVRYCVTDAGQAAPSLDNNCWTQNALTSATYKAGRDIHVLYPLDPSPDSIAVTPSFSMGNNAFRNKTTFVFQEPLVVKAIRANPDVGKIVIVPKLCTPGGCFMGICADPICTPELAFPGISEIGPLYTRSIDSDLQKQELTIFEETWSLGGFQPAPGIAFSMDPLLDPMITITRPAPESASYGTAFDVNATAKTCVIIEGTGGCSGYAIPCTTGYPAKITMTSGTTDCTIHYRSNNFTGYISTEITEVVRAKKIDTTTTVSSGATSSSIAGDSVALTATVTGTTTGTVTFTEGASALCSSVPLSGGQAVCNTSALSAEAHTITATYDGDEYHKTSSGTVTHTVVWTPMHVKENGSNSGLCESWVDSCDLKYALGLAPPGVEIWAQSGVYKPTAGTDRSATFQLKKGVKIYGGFSGTETDLSQRIATRLTVLSGDIGTAGDNSDNSYHVVTASGTDNTTLLDGFTITGGNADNSSGGGIYNNRGSPVISNVTLSGNTAVSGGGMYNFQSSPSMTNVTFSANTAVEGAGMSNFWSSPSLTNVTLSANTATYQGGAIYNVSSDPNLHNCIVWGNAGGQIYNASGTATLTSSIVEGGCPAGGACDGSVIASDPLLDPAGLQYNSGPAETIALQAASPAIDAAAAGSCPSTDARGIARPQGAGCDIGAYEWGGLVTVAYTAGLHGSVSGGNISEFIAYKSNGPQVTAVPDANYRFVDWSDGSTQNPRRDLNVAENIIVTANFAATRYVTEAGTGDCFSWASACGFQEAVALADPGDEIWVQAGTYRPTAGMDRAVAFRLKSGVRIYGGFSGTETEFSQRDIAANQTILSGDIGASGDHSDNSYHVVDGSGMDGTTILDGFVISGGNANAASPDDNGGGIIINGSLQLSNIQLQDNTSANMGGAIYLANGDPGLSNVTVNGNTALYGGGMYIAGGNPTLSNVTIAANTASVTGGGLFVGGNPTLTNVTIALNTATYHGGAIYNSGNTVLENCIIGTNTVLNPVYLRDTLPLYNDSGWPPYIPGGTFTISNSSVRGGCPSGGTCSNVIDSTGLLGTLGSYGGPTPTMPLLPGSTAIDAGDPSSCPPTDQRGISRVGACDMGAFESRGFMLAVSSGSNQSTKINTDFSSPLSVTVASPSGDPVDGGAVTFTGPSSGAGFDPLGWNVRTITGGVSYCYGKANGTGGGPYTVTGSASGAADSVGFQLTNDRYNQSITVTAHAPQSALYQGTFNVAATGGASGNPVLITTAGGCSGSGTGSAAITMTSGTTACTVLYDQAGNDNYNSAQVSETVTAGKLDQTISVTTHAPATAKYGTEFTVAAATSNQEFAVAISASGSCSGSGTGLSTIRPTQGSGTCTIQYTQPGDDNYNPTVVSEVTMAVRGDRTVTVTRHAPATATHGTIFSVAAEAPYRPWGWVGIEVSGACKISDSSIITDPSWTTYTTTKTITMTSGAGDCTVNYMLPSDYYYVVATWNEFVGALKADSALSVNSGANPSGYGESVITATVPADATGTITFTEGSTPHCSMSPVNGRAACSIPSLVLGSHSITATYSGDGNYNGSAGTIALSVNKADSAPAVVSSKNPASVGDAVAFTATVGGYATGTMTFSVDGQSQCPYVPMEEGTARCELSFADAGSHIIVAEYSGDSNYNATSETVSQIIIPHLIYAKEAGPTEGFCDSWANACDLQYALSLAFADSGTEIWAQKGTYRPTAGTDRTATFRLKNSVAVYGGFDGTETDRAQRDFTANETILSGDLGANSDNTDNSYHVVDGSGTDNTAVLDGFTVTGGYADGEYWNGGFLNDYPNTGDGGGVFINGGSPSLSNLTVTLNASEGHGGGIYNMYGSPVLTNVTIGWNTAGEGGGIYSYQGNPSLTGVTFSRNSASSGGGMYIDFSNVSMTDVTFSQNTADDGGGMYNYGSYLPSSTNLTFSGNTAGYGGGLYNHFAGFDWSNLTFIGNTATNGGAIYNTDNCSLTLTDAVFSGNTANGQGGAIYNWSYSSVALTNATFSGNTAAVGGGLYSMYSSGYSLTNVTLSGNAATVDGGAIASYEDSYALLANSIVWGNTAPEGMHIYNDYSSSSGAEYSIVEGGCPAGGWCVGGVIESDPMLDTSGLKNNGGPTGTIALLAGSPAIDAANGAYCPATDQRGISRPQGSGCDIGAFESGGLVAVTYIAGPNGSIFEGDISQSMPYGTDSPRAIAVPDPGYRFVSWSDGSMNNPRLDKGVVADISVTAEFAVKRLYVKESDLSSGLCDSWASACDLQYALGLAGPDTGVWVQAGTYRPTSGADRTATFQLKNGAAVYGGFSGTETDLSQRDSHRNITILSGDIGLQGDESDNSYHVVTGSGTGNNTILDGFTISGGNANGSDIYSTGSGGGMFNIGGSPNLSSITFSGNSAVIGGGMFNSGSSPILADVSFSGNAANVGGGMLNFAGSSPLLTNVTFSGNLAVATETSVSGGGGMYNDGGAPVLLNVTFRGNSADYGGGMYNQGSSPTVKNATFSGNSAVNPGSAMTNHQSSPVLVNCIFWGNPSPDGSQVYNETSTPAVSYSIVQGGCPDGSTCTDLIDADPLLDPAGLWDNGGATGTVALLTGSPAINAGNDAICAATDQRGTARPQGSACDIGAYEFVPATVTTVVSSLHPSTYGSSVTFTATVSDSELASEPAGTVTFKNGGVDIAGCAEVALSARSAACPVATLPTGAHAISATYSGDSSFSGSTSNSLTQIVNRGNQTITFGTLPAMTYGDISFTLAATASSGLPVSYASDNADVAIITAEGLVRIVGAGSATIMASQAGDSNHASAIAQQTLSVAKALLTVTAQDESRAYDAVNPVLTTLYTGFVHSDTAAILAGAPHLTTTAEQTSPAGDYPITIAAGNLFSNNYSFSFINGTLTIQQSSQTISGITAPPTATYGDGPISLSASASSGLEVVTSVLSGPGVINDNQLIITGAGIIGLQYSQPGDGNYSAAPSVVVSIAVAKDSATVTFANLIHTYDGTAKSATATTSPADLTVTFTYNGSTVPPTDAGSYAVIATISDADYQGTASGTLVINAYPTLFLHTPQHDFTTNEPHLTVNGTVNNVIVSVTVNGQPVIISDGAFSTLVVLLEGTNTLTVVAGDSDGNEVSESRIITLDSTGPALTIVTPTANSATNETTVTVSGAGGDASVITVAIGNGSPQNAAITNGSYTLDLVLTEGIHTLTVTATDALGNSSTQARTLTVDLSAPHLAITLPAADTTVRAMPVTISGTVYDAFTEVGLLLTVNGQVVTPTVSGSTFSYQLAATDSGSFQVRAVATDALDHSATVIRNIIYAPYGDADGNGSVAVTDALLVLKMAVGLITPDLVQGDVAPLVNGKPQPDGRINAADALVILRRSIGALNW